MMNMPRDRRAMSSPFTHGTTTSLFGRPFTFVGWRSRRRAASPGISNGPTLPDPRNETPAFSWSRPTPVKSTPEVKSLLILLTGSPSSVRSACEPSSCPTIETRTSAPSTTHSSSDHAMKMSPLSLIRSSVVRFAPSRIGFVASNPARLVSPAATCCRAISCQ